MVIKKLKEEVREEEMLQLKNNQKSIANTAKIIQNISNNSSSKNNSFKQINKKKVEDGLILKKKEDNLI